MYRINDRSEAIKRVQKYLAVASSPDIFVAPTGIFDENTCLSVIYFQTQNDLPSTGVVDYTTFTRLYDDYVYITEMNDVKRQTDSFIDFPLLPGYIGDPLIHINRTMRRVLDHYGITNTLGDSNFYSAETSKAVKELRIIYLLEEKNMIDEELYLSLMRDHDSIGKIKNIM